MKKISVLFIVLMMFLTFSLSACKYTSNAGGNTKDQSFDGATYVAKDIDVYREKGVVDKTLPLRFYDETPSVPYIGVSLYFDEFYGFDSEMLKVEARSSVFKYTLEDLAYITFDTDQDIITIYNLDHFEDPIFFAYNSSKMFIDTREIITTEQIEKVMSLHAYGIDVHNDKNEVYAPIALLNELAGGYGGYVISYNGNAVYVLDLHGNIDGEIRDIAYFGDEYYSVINDMSLKRPDDMIEYNYNQLCFVFDNLRGYTKHLYMGDNNLLSIGLNGTLERFCPEVKAALLSSDKSIYLAGFLGLMAALNDGGHTGCGIESDSIMDTAYAALATMPAVKDLYVKSMMTVYDKYVKSTQFKDAKATYLGVTEDDYYVFDAATKTAIIGFDQFKTDIFSWDSFYTEVKDATEAPVDTDTYAFVRSKLYQALSDGAENVVLDITTNGGGIESALAGVIGLLNGGESIIPRYDTLAKKLYAPVYYIDVDLDGDIDEDDIKETEKFKALNIGVLTSSYAFSSGNNLPCFLKELGYKIIGEQSGGGNCSVRSEVTADGIPYSRSGFFCKTNANGDNIDGGVPTDFAISVYDENGDYDLSKFFDFGYLAAYLSSAYTD